MQLASKWWHVWEYGVGITYNPNSNNSVSIMRQSTGGGSISWSHGNAATEIGANWDRISYTTFMDYNKENRTASFYHQWYLRTGPTAGLMVAAIVTGVAAAAVFGVIAAIA